MDIVLGLEFVNIFWRMTLFILGTLFMASIGLVGMFNLMHFGILTTLTLTLDLCYEYISPFDEYLAHLLL